MSFWECLALLTASQIDTGCYLRSWLLKTCSALALTGLRGCFSPREPGRCLSWCPVCTKGRSAWAPALLSLLLQRTFRGWQFVLGLVLFFSEVSARLVQSQKKWNMVWILNSVFIHHESPYWRQGLGLSMYLSPFPPEKDLSSLWKGT